MAETYDPPESKIQDVIKRTGGDPRKLAIAYLRAQHRARGAEAAFDVMEGLQDATMGLAKGDTKHIKRSLDRMSRRVHQHNDITSSN